MGIGVEGRREELEMVGALTMAWSTCQALLRCGSITEPMVDDVLFSKLVLVFVGVVFVPGSLCCRSQAITQTKIRLLFPTTRFTPLSPPTSLHCQSPILTSELGNFRSGRTAELHVRTNPTKRFHGDDLI